MFERTSKREGAVGPARSMRLTTLTKAGPKPYLKGSFVMASVHVHQRTCNCEDCIIKAVERTLEPPIEEVLLKVWALAIEDVEFWSSEAWPLIFRVETARRDGDSDGDAEDELRAMLHGRS